MTENEKKTKEMLDYENETGKYAIWRGNVTDGFKRWKNGEKIYDKDKDRISFYVMNDVKEKWQESAKNFNYSTISKFIRDAVNNFIENKSDLSKKGLENSEIDSLSRLSHCLKEPLTSIKGYLQLMLEEFGEKLDNDFQSIIEKILKQSKLLERRIIENLDKIKTESSQYDVLIVEDNVPTLTLIQNFFETKGFSFKSALTGMNALDTLKNGTPKLILLDILLPDIIGYDICKYIKNNERTKNIPVYYITAIPASKVDKKMEETKADGIIFKPFNLSDLSFLIKYLDS